VAVRGVAVGTWLEFKQRLLRFTSLPHDRQRRFIFRGQADSSWALETTLDRKRKFASDKEREECRSRLVAEFRRLTRGLEREPTPARPDVDWELLGRHHGLPTPVLDWTMSPYIAAFFAFEAEPSPAPGNAVVWMLDRSVFLSTPVPEVQLIDSEDAAWFNPRAIEQRGVFLKVDTISKSLEDLLTPGLARMTIPWSERPSVLADLDASLINARSLFRDLDGAARTAATRVLSPGAQS